MNTVISFENFYLKTFAVFKICKRPKRKADFVSFSNYGISSEYWYGEDSYGKYVIRSSDHWSKRNGTIDCDRIASCYWELSVPKKQSNSDPVKSGKCYLDFFKKKR